jgi:hypothetical protein
MTSLENAINRACSSLRKRGIGRHRHGRSCRNLLKHVLHKDEETIIEAKQSLLASINPARIIATRRRLIAIEPSFWGLYLGHDLTSSTRYAVLTYRHILSVTVSRGMLLSSIKLHVEGAVDPSSTLKAETEMHGIPTSQAATMATFIEEVIELMESDEAEEKRTPVAQPQHSYSFYKGDLSYGITFEEAKSMVESGNTRFLWMGVEPDEEVDKVLGVSRDKMVQMSGSHLLKCSKPEVEKMLPLVLVSYDGIMALHTSRMLKKKYGIDVSVLRGGIMGVASAMKEGVSEFLQ